MPGGGVYYRGHFYLLCVNIEQIAMLRETQGNGPDLIESILMFEKSGCDGITAHLREDRRYVKDRDVFAIKEVVVGKYNLEIALVDENISIAGKVKPNQVVIVPENRHQHTVESGLDVGLNLPKIKDTVKLLNDEGISVSLCVEPEPDAIELSKECGADFIQIHTGKYCNAVEKTDVEREINRIYSAAAHAVKVGLKVSAGHGLSYENITPVLYARALEEVNIGRSIVTRSAVVGIPEAIDEMFEILD